MLKAANGKNSSFISRGSFRFGRWLTQNPVADFERAKQEAVDLAAAHRRTSSFRREPSHESSPSRGGQQNPSRRPQPRPPTIARRSTESEIFYREAGPKDAPTIVLPHSFPSSSREFDTLIPLLATRYEVIAPDFPGFGHSEAPPPSAYLYTFDHLAETMDNLLVALKVSSYTLCTSMTTARRSGCALCSAHPRSGCTP